MRGFQCCSKYRLNSVDLVVFAGKEYETGSSRDWAAKGTKIIRSKKAVIAESFERIHRSNLVGMGILPLELIDNIDEGLNLLGDETFDLGDLSFYQKPNKKGEVRIKFSSGKSKIVNVISRIDTDDEIKFYKADGIMPYKLGKIIQ